MMDRTIPESHRADSSTPFPIDLYRMLEAASEQNLEHIVCWSQDGLGWFVRDRKAFASDVMPIFFYRLKMSSFKVS